MKNLSGQHNKIMKMKSLKSFLMFYINRLNSGTYRSVPGSPLINNEGGERVIKERHWINLLLFIITFCSTTFAGSGSSDSIKGMLISGLPYSCTLMTILTVHE